MDEVAYREAETALWASTGGGLVPTERVVALPTIGTDVRVLEVGDGEPVLFVHGASNAASSWVHLATRLPGFRCLLLDRPGCGLSPALPAPLPDLAALHAFADALVPDVLDGLRLDDAHLVGTSFGGFLSLRATASHPHRIRRLVLPGWPFGAPIEAAPLSMRIASMPRLGRVATAIPANERLVRAVLRQVGLRGALESGRFGPAEVAWFLALQRHTDTMRNELDALPRLFTLRGVDDSIHHRPELLASIRTPTLFVWGEDDPQGGAAVARPFAALVPGAALDLLPGAGHAPWIDEPDLVAERIAAFLAAD